MNKILLRRACLALTLVFPLALTSCLPHEKSVAPQTYPAGACQSCDAFSVSVWHVSGGEAGLTDFFPAQDSSTESLNSGDMKVIDAARAEAIMQLLQHNRRSTFIGKAWSTTAAGKSQLLSVNNASGAFSAEITAGPQTRKLSSRVVKLILSDSIPVTEGRVSEEKSRVSARVLLRDGQTVLSVRSVQDGWLVWLIGATFSA
ncbi:hypothetical protein [Pantoea sp. SS70]|uniref:hypothetical protein n=1 Tax=Pantoea sp. SS70 TaxID=3024247 RepID=UPI002453474F|nr:hypothetical protein [Pantoea sp. SS70]WGK59997.1 hypothetical protein PO881_23815 [Pantoea sp. SS70]